MTAAPKIALVYDWLTSSKFGGGERNFFALHQAFPDAPIYTSVYIPEDCPQFNGLDIRTTYLQKLPKFLRKWHQLLPVFRPAAFKALDLSEYDIIISMGSAEAKAAQKRPDALHINYCFTPTRYYWSHYEEYKQNPGFGPLNPLIRLAIPLFVRLMRPADLQAAEGVDRFIANSSEIATRIKQYYHKDAAIIFPPIDMNRFRNKDLGAKRQGFVLVGRQVPYKRMDLAIEACNKLKVPLTLYGDGPEHKRLQALAGPTITFVVGAENPTLVDAWLHAEGALHPQYEDFGLTQIEAMAAGCPVVAYAKGGALDVVIEGKTGVFFNEQTVDSVTEAITRLQNTRFAPKVLQMHAEQFSEEHFIKAIKEFVEAAAG